VTLSYGTASLISYVANRVLNFHSHENVNRQFPVYVAVSASNYLIFVLGLTDLLSAVGVYYEFSRVLAACCEAVYLYCMMRWVVFRDTRDSAVNERAADATADGESAASAPRPTTTAGVPPHAESSQSQSQSPSPTRPGSESMPR
jgi:GtrA-like protein